MAAIKKRLDELVTEAAERHLQNRAVRAWCVARGEEWAGEPAARLVRVAVAAVAAAARQRAYDQARKYTRLGDFAMPDWAQQVMDSGVGLEEWPAWLAFREACELAERIDCFLAAVGRGAQGAGLAADCRACLDTLLVLADWCDDQGRPAAAAEARRLHALAHDLP